LTVQSASDMTAAYLRGMATAPAWYLAAMPWCFGNRIFGNLWADFERDAWKRVAGWGNCPGNEPPTLPVIAMLLSNPCPKRQEEEPMPKPTWTPLPATPPTPQPPPSLDFTDAEMQRAREALGAIPATMKAATARGYTWLKEFYTVGDPFAFALCAYTGRAGEYRLLKLDTRTWETVAEVSL
jgi:hypothetical protein